MKRITSRQNDVVARYRAVARGESHAEMLLDGLHLVSDALHAGTAIDHALVAADHAGRPDVDRLVHTLIEAGVVVDEASAAVMAAVSPVKSPSPIVAIAARPRHTLDAVCLATGIAVVAFDIQDPGNLGAIVRVAEAAGAAGLAVAGVSADPFGWKALRASMGSALRLPIATLSKSQSAVDTARTRGLRTVATVPRDGQPLFEADLLGGLALLVGGEGGGLEAHLAEAADLRITIPMHPPVESLNAAVACAVVLYEAHRQRLIATR
jgi:TrmH family RNA methyltransferase